MVKGGPSPRTPSASVTAIRRGAGREKMGIAVFLFVLAIAVLTQQHQHPPPLGTRQSLAPMLFAHAKDVGDHGGGVGVSPEFEWQEEPSKRDRNCEVCQMMVELSCSLMDERLRSRRKQLGSVDLAMQEILDPMELCSYHTWMKFDGKSEGLSVADMTATCALMLSENEELLETQLLKLYKDPRKLAEVACVEHLSYCGSVWPETDRPEKRESRGDRNSRLGKLFLEWNSKQEGVVETASGLQYKILKKASELEAPRVQESDAVEVLYTGTLLNGRVFDSTDFKGSPAEFKLDGVISGWKEGLQLMHEGAKYEFFVPPHLAYGSSGSHDSIGPNETLKFVVELVKIKPKAATTTATDAVKGDSGIASDGEEELGDIEDLDEEL